MSKNILVGIDVSGSMDCYFDEITDELNHLVVGRKIVICEFDYEIRRMYNYNGRIEMLNAGQGTDFNPLFEESFLKQNQIDLVVIFSDGMGPAPEQVPLIPVVWCLVGDDAKSPVSWGSVMKLMSNQGVGLRALDALFEG
jgi:predicted metal-dependent peptidase